MIIQILSTPESKTFSFVHQYEKGGKFYSGGCNCQGGCCQTEDSTETE
jgi:hypothetical protein